MIDDCPKPPFTCKRMWKARYVKANFQARGPGGISNQMGHAREIQTCNASIVAARDTQWRTVDLESMTWVRQLDCQPAHQLNLMHQNHCPIRFQAAVAAALSSSNKKLPLMLNSGATNHIFPSSDYFSEYSEVLWMGRCGQLHLDPRWEATFC